MNGSTEQNEEEGAGMREDVTLQMEEVDPLDLFEVSLYDPSCTHTHP